MSRRSVTQLELFSDHDQEMAQSERIKALEEALRKALPVVRLALYRNLAAKIEALLGSEHGNVPNG